MNTGAPWLDFSQAEAQVLAMQTKLHGQRQSLPVVLMICSISSMPRHSWRLPGPGCGTTRAGVPLEWTGSVTLCNGAVASRLKLVVILVRCN